MFATPCFSKVMLFLRHKGREHGKFMNPKHISGVLMRLRITGLAAEFDRLFREQNRKVDLGGISLV